MNRANPPFIIRAAAPADAAALAPFAARAFLDAFLEDNDPQDIEQYVREAFNQENIRNEIASEDTLFLLAFRRGSPSRYSLGRYSLAGYAELRSAQTPSCVRAAWPIELVRLYARADQIGQGVGSALMSRCIEEARERGHDCIWLGVWERNPRAIAFYNRWGYRVIGSHDFMMGRDLQTDLIMARRLARR